jgi:FkbM family methyltransferase
MRKGTERPRGKAAVRWPDGFPWRGRIAQLRNGLAIEVDPSDLIGREILRQGCWEWETFCFLEAWLAPGMTVIDAGANVGQYAMLASTRVGPRGRVHCFEPHPGVYRVLAGNLERAGCANVVARPLALAATPGSRDLFLQPIGNVGATSFKPSGAGRSGRRVRVKATTLDAYVKARRLGRVDLIKIDVEGAELEVLQGAARTLDANLDIVLVVEFLRENSRRFGYSVEELEAYLRVRGFRLFSIAMGGLDPYRPVGELSVNVIAARRLATLVCGLPDAVAALLLRRLARTALPGSPPRASGEAAGPSPGARQRHR